MRFFIPLRSIQNDNDEATKTIVISNEPLGEVRDFIALRCGYTKRFFIPLRSIQNDNDEATKSIVISNEPIGDVRDLIEETAKNNEKTLSSRMSRQAK